MERIDKTVFISYRRTNIPWALAIFQNLTQNGYDVFFDYNGIASGDFEQAILGNITARAHFLVILTPSALERCSEPGDWLRREIETALDSRRNIVPLMLEGFDFGTPKIATQLTGTLAPLKQYNGLSVPPEYFLEAMSRLRERYLNVPLTAVLHPATPSALQAATEQKASADTAPLVQEKELTAQQWFERGLGAADVDEKLRFYSQAIRLQPEYADAFINRGSAWYSKCDFGRAMKDYAEAIRLKPDSGPAFYGRGIARYNKGSLELALRDCSKAIQLKPDFADAFCGRGIVRNAKGDFEGAIEDFSEAIRLKPDCADAFGGRGLARYRRGVFEGAIEDNDEAIRLRPDYAIAFDNRGLARQSKGDLEGAIKDHTEAIRLKPDLADAFCGRGLAWYRKGDFQGAIEDYTEAIRLKPDYALAFYSRSLARHAIGDRRGAREDKNEAIRLGYKPKA
jgi:tetratricopeptide (TPR) repeat protein